MDRKFRFGLSKVLLFLFKIGFGATFTNPVLPGDHPDPSLLKVADDFYTTYSSFHVSPGLEILHSKDLVNWEIISRVVPPDWVDQSSTAGKGGWGGTITFFYGKYWAYFGVADIGQFVSSASNPAGPWSTPISLGSVGQDNSVFVDDDGQPYLLVNWGGFCKLGTDGKPIGGYMEMQFVRDDPKNQIAEGPVMFKRNGYYYWCAATNAWGHEIVYKSNYNSLPLRNGASNWTRLGDFSSESATELGRPNHHSITVQISDGTWWNLSHSPVDNWGGLGRPGCLSQVLWNGDIPKCVNPITTPLTAPNLPSGGIGKKFPYSDEFSKAKLDLTWNFFGKTPSTKWSLTDRSGWIRLKPDTSRMMVVQKMAEKSYYIITKVEFNPTSSTTQAGLIQLNGDETQSIKLVVTSDSGSKIRLIYNKSVKATVTNPIGKTLWLKLVKSNSIATGFYSADGKTWTQVGTNVDVNALDKSFAGWIGNYQGLYCIGANADFDAYYYNQVPSITAAKSFTPASTFKQDQVSLQHGPGRFDVTVLNLANLAIEDQLKLLLYDVTGHLLSTLIVSSATRQNTLVLPSTARGTVLFRVMNGKQEMLIKSLFLQP